ncbi:MAG: LamG domain-containing protein [Candidatus Altiarchaeota archaeon]|nr:LamG domain-containing protein [Candidatus Altiarchaeota archaeon]
MKKPSPNSKKAQVFTWDVVIATLIFLVFISILIVMWIDTVTEMSSAEMHYEISWLSTAISEQLVRTPGSPSNWSENPVLENITIMGLADLETIGNTSRTLDRVLDADKLMHFINLTKNNYGRIKSKFFSAGKYDFYVELYCPDSQGLDCFNGLDTETIDYGNITCNNGPVFYMENHTVSTGRNTTAIWHFNEISGETVYDASGNDNMGLIHGATRTEGRDGNGLYFNGSGDYVYFGNETDLGPASEITIQAWIKPSDVTRNYATVISSYRKNAPAGNGYALGFDADSGRISFGVTTAAESCVTDTSALANDAWHHVTGVYNGSKMLLYVNGVLKNSIPKTGVIQKQDNASIGAAIKTPGLRNYFYGTIDEVKIWSRALSEDEIKKEYENMKMVCTMGKEVLINDTEAIVYDTKTVTFSEKANEGGIREDLPYLDSTARIKVVIYRARETS